MRALCRWINQVRTFLTPEPERPHHVWVEGKEENVFNPHAWSSWTCANCGLITKVNPAKYPKWDFDADCVNRQVRQVMES